MSLIALPFVIESKLSPVPGLAMTLADNLAAYSEWRSELSQRLARFSGWLVENELTDAQTDRRISLLLDKLREDRLHVAFVAEFSRGKSELINAIFFADYGNRILPSTAGRTTMCPTELMFDAKQAGVRSNCCRSLAASPITQYQRVQALSRRVVRRTSRHVASAGAMQETLRQVSEVTRVDRKVAERLGFSIVDDTLSFALVRMVASRSPAGGTRSSTSRTRCCSKGW
jgi:hypothetical protein